jgi:peptidase S46-like protein
MRTLLYAALLFVAAKAFADEGMWTLDRPPLARIQAATGVSLSQAWLDKAMHASGRLANGCSASFISENGLVLTNHHCVEECAEELSSDKRDLEADGFKARAREEELRCPAMELDQLERISDVTREVKLATANKSGEAFKLAQNAVEAKLRSACVGTEGSILRCDVVDLYHGGEFKMYRYHRYQDVRLVFAPEEAAAAFGGDPDNFNFPRFDLDFSLLRVYQDDRPVQVRDFFRVSATGPHAGDAVFVVGNPGGTRRAWTTSQLMLQRNVVVPELLTFLAEYRGILEQYRTEGSEQARVAGGDLASVENYYKLLHGEFATLLNPGLFEAKRAQEMDLKRYVASHADLKSGVGGAWDSIDKAMLAYRDFRTPFALLEGRSTLRTRYFRIARTLVRGAVERPKPDPDRLEEFTDTALPQLEADLFSPAPIYPEYEKVKLTFGLTKLRERLGTDDPIVVAILGSQSPAQLAARLIDGTRLGDPQVRRALWDGGEAAIEKSEDPMIRLAVALDPVARKLRKRYESEVEAVEEKNSELIATALFAKFGTSLYPDATFSLRLSYGKVQGWVKDGTPVPPFTDFAGAFRRATGADPYRLPDSWLQAKDRLALDRPLNFTSTNDIIGGNSGSPALNGDGELVGLIFDGNLESLGADFWYEPDKNRSISVDTAAILEVLDKIYDLGQLAREMRSD